MTLDELVNSLKNTEPELHLNLEHWIHQWKISNDNIEQLDYLLSKWYGNVWFKKPNDSNEFYKNLKNFREKAISNISRLTLNERLYLFSLAELWDLNDYNIQEKIKTKFKVN